MSKLTKEQIAILNAQINDGTTLTTVHNSKYHLIVNVNTECIVIRSMEAEDNSKGLLINLKEFRDELNNGRTSNPEQNEDTKNNMENS